MRSKFFWKLRGFSLIFSGIWLRSRNILEASKKAEKMIEERKELMLSSPHENGEGICILKNAHFLKPVLKPNTPFPKHPCISLTTKPHITLLKTMVSFNCKSQSQQNWVTWVDNMSQTYQQTWQKVGIFDAIRATTCKFRNHNELILGLAEKWNPDTNTFVFPFGEATITLEDVMILGGYSVLGECGTTLPQTPEVEGIKETLLSSFLANGTENSDWIGNFTGLGGEIEHIAFLVLWLSRYVFPLKCYNNNYICPLAFPIAIALARGTRIALAPAILAAIYRDLRLLKAKIVDFVGQGEDNVSKLVLSAPFQLVQWWVWERFTVLSPKPASSPCGEPRIARWPKFRKTRVSLFRFEFESLGECFIWKPYALYVTNKEFYEFYCDQGKSIVINSELELSDALVSFARCLRPCELVGLDTIEQYLPHRVGMQFGFDQDIPCPVSRCNQSVAEAWGSYTKPLDGEVLCLLPRLLRGEVSTRYNDWWKTESYHESYHCNIQIRRSNRIAKIMSRKLNVNSPRQHEERATICLSSSSNIASESSFVNDGGQEMQSEKSPSKSKYANDCENGDNCNSIRVEVVPPSPSQTDDMDIETTPKSSEYYISSDDDMDIETTPTIPNTCRVENVVSEIIQSETGTRAGDISEDAPSQNLKRVAFDLLSEDNNAASDVGCSKLPEGKKLVFPKQTLRNDSPGQHKKRATICLSSSSNIASESRFVNDGGQEMHTEKSPSEANYVNDCENEDSSNNIRVEVVPPSPSVSDIPKSSEYYSSSADDMDIETTPTIPNTRHVENVDSEIIPSQNGSRAEDILEDAPSQSLKRVIDLPREDNTAANDVECSKLPEGKKLVFPKQTLRNGSQCDPLLIEDDENDNEDKRVKAIVLICSEFESRMCKLEAAVWKNKAPKFRSNGKTAFIFR